jgi:L-lactate dehydrogenase (cytochrome)
MTGTLFRRRHTLAGILNHSDARLRARRVLPIGMWEFVDGGAQDELTLARNLRAFAELRFRPRMAQWHPQPELACSILGSQITMPILVAPCGGLRQVHPDGDLAVARAAAAAGTIHIVSSASGFTLETVATASAAPKWLQIYRLWGHAGMESLVNRAISAKYQALVVTVDTPVAGARERDARYGLRESRMTLRRATRFAPHLITRPRWVARYVRDGMPFGLANAVIGENGRALPLTAMSRSGDESLCASWADVDWLRQNWRGPLVVKGILTGEDARRAVAAGADGIVVSNHGGRQLDSAPASIEMLPEVADAVGGTVEILVDTAYAAARTQ